MADEQTPADHDRSTPNTVGVEFIGSPEEFGLLNAARRAVRNTDDFVEAGQRYWTTARRSAKAKKQLRHWKTKQWIKSRINFDFPGSDDEAVRAQIGNIADDDIAYAKAKRVSGNPAKRAQQMQEKLEKPVLPEGNLKEKYRGIKFLSPAEIRKNLENSDLPAEEIENYAKNNLVITRDGVHMVVIPTELSGNAAEIQVTQEKIGEINTQIKFYDEIIGPLIKAKQPIDQDTRRDYNALLQMKADAERKLKDLQIKKVTAQKKPLRSKRDSTNLSDYYLQIASISLDEIERATAIGVPEWRLYDNNGQRRPFIVDLEPQMFAGKSNVFGFTIPGSDKMHINPDTFDLKLAGTLLLENHFMKNAQFEMIGVYSIHHELGHQVDSSPKIQSTWESGTRFDLMEKAKATREIGKYAKSRIVELYAEAWALRQYQLLNGRPYTPLTKMMSEAFGWDLKKRPAQSPASTDPNIPYVMPLSPAEQALFRVLADNLGKIATHDLAAAKLFETAAAKKYEGDYEALRSILQQFVNNSSLMKLLVP